MIAALAIIILALAWLTLETRCLRIRLLAGPVAATRRDLPPPAMLRVKHGVGLWSVARSYAVGWLTLYEGMTYKWNRDGTGGKWHVNTSEVKQYRSTGVRTDARCPRCQNPYSSRYNVLAPAVSTYTETVGNSTVTFTICDDCLPKLRAEIERSQCAKPSKPSVPARSNAGLPKGDGEMEIRIDGERVRIVTADMKVGTVKALVKAHR